jgi:hypothetical protein
VKPALLAVFETHFLRGELWFSGHRVFLIQGFSISHLGMNHPQECCRSSSIGVTSCEIPLACAHLRHPVETNCGVGPTVGHGPVACSRRASTDDLDINGALDCALDFYQSEMCVVGSLTAVDFSISFLRQSAALCLLTPLLQGLKA